MTMDRGTRLFIRANAALYLILGLLLTVSPWFEGVFATLGLPNPQPPLWTQFAGAVMLPYAFLLWSPDTRVLLVTIAANLLMVIVIAAWVFTGSAIGLLGALVLLLIGVLLFVFVTVEIRYLRLSRIEPPPPAPARSSGRRSTRK